jgi:hypothetical protein
MKLRIARLGGGHCEELRLACENKDRLGEQGEGNCRRYRQMCGQRQSRQQVCEQLLRVSRRISSASRARAIVGDVQRLARLNPCHEPHRLLQLASGPLVASLGHVRTGRGRSQERRVAGLKSSLPDAMTYGRVHLTAGRECRMGRFRATVVQAAADLLP